MAALVSAVFLVVFGALLGNGLDLEPFRNPMPSHVSKQYCCIYS